MNLLQDGTGWILPPRCASRYTLGLLWKYGLSEFTGHYADPEMKPKKIVMNIRNPATRFYSFWRMIADRMEMEITFDDYLWNLVENVLPYEFTNHVKHKRDGQITDNILRYPIPLFRFCEKIAPQTVDHFVCVEHLEEDLDAAGYPVLDHGSHGVTYESNMEPSVDDVLTNKKYMEVIKLYYGRDFKEFGYDNPCLTYQ